MGGRREESARACATSRAWAKSHIAYWIKVGRPIKARARGACVGAREKTCRKSGRRYRPLFVRVSQASGSGSGVEREVLRMEERKGKRSSYPVARRIVSM